jgi:hypothetical protein
MKLYYWSQVDALADWMPGKVFVLASSLEEARRMVRERDAPTEWDWNSRTGAM